MRCARCGVRGWKAGLMLAMTLALDAAPRLVAAQPIALHPANPHYFIHHGRPTIIVTSGEHYGAVLNPDFDQRSYLRALARDGLNYTRLFTGSYFEPQGAFGIRKNTMAPEGSRALTPWARSGMPGYAGGGNRFDLSQWDTTYFRGCTTSCAWQASMAWWWKSRSSRRSTVTRSGGSTRCIRRTT